MSYKTQLVIRAHNDVDVATVQKLRAIAKQKGQNFTQMALELINAGIEAQGLQDIEFEMPEEKTSEPETVSEAPEPESEMEVGKTHEASASLKASSEFEAQSTEPETSQEPETPPIIEAVPEPNEIEEFEEGRYVSRDLMRAWISGDVEEAVENVAELFEDASFSEGRAIKDELQERLSEADYEELMADVKRTEHYRVYKERAIYGDL